MLGQRLGGGDAVHHRHPHVQADDVGRASRARRRSPRGRRRPRRPPRCRRPPASRLAMPRRTIALSSTSRTRITAMCTPARRAGPYRTARRRLGGRLRRAGGGAGASRRASGGRDPDRQHAALPGRGLDAQVPAGQLRALAHADDAEVAPARELVQVVGRPRSPSPSSAIVSTARPPSVRSRTATARRARVALDVAQRLAQDPLQLARGDGVAARPRPRSRASSRTPLRGRPALRLGPQRHRAAAARRPSSSVAQARDDLARLARRLARVLGEPPRLGRRALRVALDPARERERGEADARDGLGQRVVHVAREPRALAPRRPSGAPARRAAPPPPPGGPAAARAPAPAAATIAYSAGWPRSVWKFDGTASTPARTETTQ